jgi:DMSO/TMAO reductase YedYZ molybdopterin-dependent catalytic subunit
VESRVAGLTSVAQQLALKTVQESPYNAETPLSALAHVPTPAQLFYVRSNFAIPRLSLADWRLTVAGAVTTPRTFSFDELERFPRHDALVLLECAGNGRRRMVPVPSGVGWDLGAVSCAVFRGIRLSDVLAACNPSDKAVEVLFVGADVGEVSPGRVIAFERSLPIERALDPAVLLASEMNGAPLTPEHGYPMRVLVPRWYAVSSVKWITEIRVLEQPFTGHFQTERYVYLGDASVPDGTPVREMRVRALIAQPEDSATVSRGDVVVRGIAWSGAGRIAMVEVSTDNGTSWQAGSLTEPRTQGAPVLWSFVWKATPGVYTILARATDAAGNTQPLDSVYNNLGYGNNLVQRIRVTVY